jgi:hypothetical protein
MRSVFVILAVCVLALQAWCAGFAPDGIVFMRLSVANSAIKVDSVWRVEGSFKIPREIEIPNSAYFYEIAGESGKILYTDRLDNLFKDEFEYPADDNGTLKWVEIDNGNKIVVIRFPAYTGTIQIRLVERETLQNSRVIWEKLINIDNADMFESTPDPTGSDKR